MTRLGLGLGLGLGLEAQRRGQQVGLGLLARLLHGLLQLRLGRLALGLLLGEALLL